MRSTPWQHPAGRSIFLQAPKSMGRFSISTTRGQHHVPSSTLDASCVASSRLPLQPTDVPSLLTEQIAHYSPLLETTRKRHMKRPL
jgi:hypothetical protein